MSIDFISQDQKVGQAPYWTVSTAQKHARPDSWNTLNWKPETVTEFVTCCAQASEEYQTPMESVQQRFILWVMFPLPPYSPRKMVN